MARYRCCLSLTGLEQVTIPALPISKYDVVHVLRKVEGGEGAWCCASVAEVRSSDSFEVTYRDETSDVVDSERVRKPPIECMGFGTTNLVVVRQLLQAALDGHNSNSQEQGARAAVTHVIRSDVPGDHGTSTSHGNLYEYLQNTPLVLTTRKGNTEVSSLALLRGRVGRDIAKAKLRKQGGVEEEVEEEEEEEEGGEGEEEEWSCIASRLAAPDQAFI
jgi:hypothetical protein